MTSMAWHDTFAAAFDVTSLLTSLFAGDWPEQQVTVDPAVWAVAAAAHASRNWADMVPVHPLPALTARHRRTLFHERVHYSQLMSLPLQQAGFMLDLERIKATALSSGGTRPLISGLTYGDDTLSQLELYHGYRSVRANFLTPALDQIRTFDAPGTLNMLPELDVAMPFVMFPWGSADDPELLPAYLGLLVFPDAEDPALVPFSGQNLLESAAY